MTEFTGGGHRSFFSEKAFTLAEVLITLGIIGIVAAMTMPTLVAKYKEKQRVTQLKKAYSILNQAFTMAVNDYGTPDNWGLVKAQTGEMDDEGNEIIDHTGNIKVVNILKKYVKQKTLADKEVIGYVNFNFRLTKKGFVPNGMKDYTGNSLAKFCNTKGTSVSPDEQGRGCTAWVIFNENMDYLRCNDLSWDENKKCK